MAITILPKEGGFGETLGASLGTGLGSALQGLSQGANKRSLAQLFQQQGLPAGLAFTEPGVQASYLKNAASGQRNIEKANKPFRESVRKGGDVADLALPILDELEGLGKTTTFMGPIAGRLPGFTSQQQRMDSLNNELLLLKAPLQAIGSRGTNLYYKLQEAAKLSRTMNSKAYLARVNDLRNEFRNLKLDNSISDQIIQANDGLEPKNFDSMVHNVRKVYKRLVPQLSKANLPEGSIIDESGYQFMINNGEPVFVGKAQ